MAGVWEVPDPPQVANSFPSQGSGEAKGGDMSFSVGPKQRRVYANPGPLHALRSDAGPRRTVALHVLSMCANANTLLGVLMLEQ